MFGTNYTALRWERFENGEFGPQRRKFYRLFLPATRALLKSLAEDQHVILP